MENKYNFRAAVENDIDSIFMIENECFQKPWTREMFTKDIINNEMARYYVIEYKSEIIGYAGYWHILDEAHITNIAVKPKYQNMGIGSLLLKNMLSLFKKYNIKKSTLEVNLCNETAIRLYEHAGFKVKGKRKAYYENGEDALIMWKEVR